MFKCNGTGGGNMLSIPQNYTVNILTVKIHGTDSVQLSNSNMTAKNHVNHSPWQCQYFKLVKTSTVTARENYC